MRDNGLIVPNEHSIIVLDELDRLLSSDIIEYDISKVLAKVDILTDMQRHIDNSVDAMNEVLSRVIKIKWRFGRILRGMQKNGGERGRFTGNDHLSSPVPPTYAELNIHPKRAQRWQLIALAPEVEIDQWIIDRGERCKLITESGAVALGRKFAEDTAIDDLQPIVSESPLIEVIHGDMLDSAQESGTFQLVIADPPYNVTGWDWDKFDTPIDFIQHTKTWLNTVKGVLSSSYNLFWFCSPQYIAMIEPLFTELGLPIQSRVVWHRRNMAMGSDSVYKFIDTWEMIFHCGNRPLNFPTNWDSSRFDVQTFAVPQTNFNDRKLHPTQKPLELIKRLVEYGSYPGDRVLDPFAGSGTTGAACKLIGSRHCTLIERDISYIEVINGRL